MFIVANGAAKQNIRSSRFPRRLVVFLVTVLHSSCAEVVIALRFSILHPPSFIPTYTFTLYLLLYSTAGHRSHSRQRHQISWSYR